jgi:hypothetical protein
MAYQQHFSTVGNGLQQQQPSTALLSSPYYSSPLGDFAALNHSASSIVNNNSNNAATTAAALNLAKQNEQQQQQAANNNKNFRAPLQTAHSFTVGSTYNHQTENERPASHSLRRAISASMDTMNTTMSMFERPASLQQPELMLENSSSKQQQQQQTGFSNAGRPSSRTMTPHSVKTERMSPVTGLNGNGGGENSGPPVFATPDVKHFSSGTAQQHQLFLHQQQQDMLGSSGLLQKQMGFEHHNTSTNNNRLSQQNSQSNNNNPTGVSTNGACDSNVTLWQFLVPFIFIFMENSNTLVGASGKRRTEGVHNLDQ